MSIRGAKTLVADTLVGINLSKRQRRQPCLVQVNGTNLGRPYFLAEKEMLIGRDPRAQIHIHDQKVSKRHALLTVNVRSVVISDLGSVNGVYVNKRKIVRPAKLKDADLIVIGDVSFKFFSAGNIEQLFFDKLYRLATIDEKTKVFNDKYFLSTLREDIETSLHFNQDLCLIMYDLDFFKKLNDTFGHVVGDLILRETAAITARVIRKNDVLCRYGGEEFAVILRDTTLATAVALAERICASIGRNGFLIAHGGGKVKLIQTASFGVVHLNKDLNSVRKLIKAADAKLYLAKKSGRNCVRY